MRAKPEMKPWVPTDKSKMSSFRSGTFSARICFCLTACHLPRAHLGYYLTLHLRDYHTPPRITKFFLICVSHSYCRHCYQLTCPSLKIFCTNIWRERKVCITFALANDREGVAGERVGRERETNETKESD